MKNTQQVTVRQINAHLFGGAGYCMVYATGWQARISWARTHNGVKQGRVVNLSVEPNVSQPEMAEDRMGLHWITVPDDARVELS